jgi:cytochrome P450
MLIAGHETTATTLAWIWEQLLRRADLVQRVRDEVDDVVGDDVIAWKHIRALRFTEAVIAEGMRLRPLAPILGARRLQAPVELGGFRLPAGTALLMGLHLLQRRPETYPEPHAFRPDRFLDVKPDPYAWAPFGGGHRRCLGMSFAMTEMKVVIATMARRTTLELDTPAVRPVRRGLFFAPEHGLRVRVR